MANVIYISDLLDREELDRQLAELPSHKKPVDLNDYVGKVNFDTDGLTYQLMIRSEWAERG